MKRKLTDILSADVKGYSRLMADDESATVGTLTAHRQVFRNIIEQHHGRVIDSPGDNLLAEFGSAVNAVQGAVEIQNRLAASNANLPEHRRMAWRIGINLGDVIFEAERIYGDGVNVAARIEGIAEPGGVCVSRSVYDQVKGKLAFQYEYLGEHGVKNIAEPVRVYRVELRTEPLALGGELKMPDRPSIAVLPFANMSGDPEQEYFSDGITEEIITSLSKVHQLFVIASNTSFTYKGKPVKVQQVGRDLGVAYVLEGSVRRAGNRVRITAQLIDATTGGHLWADRYDRDLDDIFAVQDEITFKILTELQVKLTEGEQARVHSRGTKNIQAYLRFLETRNILRQVTPDTIVLAREPLQEALTLDPEFPRAWVTLGSISLLEVTYGLSDSPLESLTRAEEAAQRGRALDGSLPDAYSLQGLIYALKRDHGRAIVEGESAISLNPNHADSHQLLAIIYHWAGRHDDAISTINKALRLNPFPHHWYFTVLGHAYNHTGRHKEAIEAFNKALGLAPDDLWAAAGLVSACRLSGREREVKKAVDLVLRIDPGFSVDYWKAFHPYIKHPANDDYFDSLRRAGLK
ncbi:MAG: tetratricopeptide repeat protein [Proteobacteria bacterium]|nr:tetratricopeptide repeat protein [Pseudomonadota bacterium]MBU1741189.1 tetratricopeptide repeat protein [Pseudomonadota bacterium]